MLFITHQLPKALQVDEVLKFGMPEAGADHNSATTVAHASPVR